MLSDDTITRLMCENLMPDTRKATKGYDIESLCRAIEAAVREELADAIRLNEEYDAVLRGLASYVGAGGFNDLQLLIDPKIADEKIRWGIDHILEIEQKRHAKQEPVAWLAHNDFGEEITIPESNLRNKQPPPVQEFWRKAKPLYAAPVALPHNGIASTPEQVDEIVDAICAKGVQPGMVMVPREPTEAMLDAAEKLDWSNEDVRGNCCNQWYAMIAAAEREQK